MEQIQEDSDVELNEIVADMLERHHLRAMVAHSGFYSCEYCLAEGRGEDGGIDFYFPANWDCEERTADAWLDIARYIRNLLLSDVNLHISLLNRNIRDEIPVRTYGITEYSPLLDMHPSFDIVKDIPIDQFHNIFEGLVKLSMSRLLRRNVVSKGLIRRLNGTYMKLRTFKESPRRPRTLNNLPSFTGLIR